MILYIDIYCNCAQPESRTVKTISEMFSFGYQLPSYLFYLPGIFDLVVNSTLQYNHLP